MVEISIQWQFCAFC